MNKLLGKLRSAIEYYNMIQDKDTIAVGVSGGKDSITLLYLLKRLQMFYPKKFNIKAIFVDPYFFNKATNFFPLKEFCETLDIDFTYVKSDIYKIVFEIRNEKNPCSLCANLRRGILCNKAKTLGCNKLALGHNEEDVVETFFMNLFNCGNIGCFSPVSYLSKKDITVIRPLIYCNKNSITKLAYNLNLPIIKSPCPKDKNSNRKTTADFINKLQKVHPDIKTKVMGALKRQNINNW